MAFNTGVGCVAKNNMAPPKKAATNQRTAVNRCIRETIEDFLSSLTYLAVKFLESFTHFSLTGRISV